MCLWILCHTQILNSTQNIEIGELIFLFLTVSLILSWLYQKIIRKGTVLNDFSDISLGIFFIMIIFSLIPALLYGNDLFKWAREVLPISSYLFYFISNFFLIN